MSQLLFIDLQHGLILFFNTKDLDPRRQQMLCRLLQKEQCVFICLVLIDVPWVRRHVPSLVTFQPVVGMVCKCPPSCGGQSLRASWCVMHGVRSQQKLSDCIDGEHVYEILKELKIISQMCMVPPWQQSRLQSEEQAKELSDRGKRPTKKMSVKMVTHFAVCTNGKRNVMCSVCRKRSPLVFQK